MRLERYKRIEKSIATSENTTILQRWRYGRRLLCDADAVTRNGNLKHGILAKLIEAAASVGVTLHEREIQRRMQCGRAYPTEAQIRHAMSDLGSSNPSGRTDLGSWFALTQANFPPVEAPPDALPYNPLETDELEAQNEERGERIAEEARYETSLFPDDEFSPSSTLAEMSLYADEQDELAARRRRYLDRLIGAVNGNMDATWEVAEAALRERGSE